MPVYLFESKRYKIAAFTTDKMGQNLPQDKGPWSILGDRMVPVENTGLNQLFTDIIEDQGFLIFKDYNAGARRTLH